MTRHRLTGLVPTSLMTYLAALGLVRVVAEQEDPRLRLRWDGHAFLVDTTVDDLVAFLVHRYVPTPIVSPWNNGSGYGAKDKNQRAALDRLVSDPSARLASFAAADEVASRVAAQGRTYGWDKERVVLEMRNWAPDAALPWLDAAVVLAAGPAGQRALFPPLLGSGGNDGRLDFSTNFHQHLASILPELGASQETTAQWCADLLEGTAEAPLLARTAGQFDAFAAGGPGTSAADEGSGLINPWAYVLMLEGSVMFAASAVSRLGEQADRMSIPFTVLGSPDGPRAGADGEDMRGEIWTPLVDHWTTWPQWRHLFAQAKRTWNRRTARTASEMYGAVQSAGVDRRVSAFARFGISQRNGLAFVAVLLDLVESRPRLGIEFTTPLGRRLDRYRSVPNGLPTRRRREVEAALLLARRDLTPQRMLDALGCLTRLELAAIQTRRGRESVSGLPPLPTASTTLPFLLGWAHDPAKPWTPPPAWRVAAALASARIPVDVSADEPPDRRAPTAPIRRFLVGELDRDGWVQPVVTGLERGDVVQVLTDLVNWRSHHVERNRGGVGQGFRIARGHRYRCPWQDMHAWVRGEIPDSDVAVALVGMLSLDYSEAIPGRPIHAEGWAEPALAVLQAFAGGHLADPQLDPSTDASRQGLQPGWPAMLASGPPGTNRVLAAATARANRSRLVQPRSGRPFRLRLATPDVPDGRRLLAALVGPSPARPLMTWAVPPEQPHVLTTQSHPA